jgi:hypothetical protein
MYDHNQLDVPDSFMALFLEPGRRRPSAPRAVVTARYEFCEDLANHLFEYARGLHHDLGIAEDEVLGRVRRGLLVPSSGASAEEAGWIVRRLAELEGWPWPDPA